MYPTVGSFGSSQQQEGHGQRPPYSQPGPPRWPPSQLLDSSVGSQNGPAPPPSSASTFPMLRVHIADQLRTSPPVMITAALEDIPRAQFSYIFDYEHQLVSRLEAEDSSARRAPIVDPFENVLNRFSGERFSREEVTMALAALGSNNPEEREIQQFCKNFKELKSMGFDIPSVVGALVLHKSDLAAATDACLSAQ